MSSQGDSGEIKELRAVLQRQMSGRDSDTTLDAPSHDTEMESKATPLAAPPTAKKEKPKKPLSETLKDAGMRALGGGLPGAMAMGIQVTSLMWLRTTMNYQYRYGTSMPVALKTLYKEGGILRFYRGYLPAIIQGPLSRFGDTASNAGMLALLDGTSTTASLPTPVKTGAASVAAGLFRIVLMPVDTVKTILQVEGKNGMSVLRGKISKSGPGALYQGSLGAAGATMVGHYPWFATYNTLQANIPAAKKDETVYKLSRNAFIGFTSSVVSDCTSNSIRVVKTTKQTYATPISYPEAVKLIIAQDGVQGLFLRGLGTRIVANGMQGMMFSVLWKYLEEALFPKK